MSLDYDHQGSQHGKVSRNDESNGTETGSLPTIFAMVKRKKQEIPVEENLDRFAGSSEEENDVQSGSDKDNESLDESEGESIDADDENQGEVESGRTKMADAMSRILGARTKGGTVPVVLSKTTTPLQRLAMKEKKREQKLRENRRTNRERNLSSLHTPLSVATSRDTSSTGPSSIAEELEMERTHRRVATRGVVALFNAISQHQKKNEVCVSA